MKVGNHDCIESLDAF